MEADYSSETYLLDELNGVATQTQTQNTDHRENISLGPYKLLFVIIETYSCWTRRLGHTDLSRVLRLRLKHLLCKQTNKMHFLYVFILQSLYNRTCFERPFRSSSGVHDLLYLQLCINHANASNAVRHVSMACPELLIQ